MKTRTPVTILGGYLGSGKTTLLNALLNAPHGLRIAVIVNDFGAVNIDASLISQQASGRIDLANGCACCQLGDSVADAFADLAANDPPFDRIIMEASGVAMPHTLAGWATLPGLVLDGVVVLIDALHVGAQASDRFIGETIRRQLQGADLAVVTKADVATSEELTDALAVIASVDANIPTLTLRHPVNLDSVFGLTHTPNRMHTDDLTHTSHHSIVWQPDALVDHEQLAALLPGIPGLARAKGTVRCLDGNVRLLQLVGRRLTWSAMPTSHDDATGLVLIGPADRFDPAQAMETLKGANL